MGNYIDGKLLERYPAKHPKEFELVYPTLKSVLNLAMGTQDKQEEKKPRKRKLSPPNIRRRKKK